MAKGDWVWEVRTDGSKDTLRFITGTASEAAQFAEKYGRVVSVMRLVPACPVSDEQWYVGDGSIPESNGWIWRIVSKNDPENELVGYVIAETMDEAVAQYCVPKDNIFSVSRVGHVDGITPAVVRAWGRAIGRQGGT